MNSEETVLVYALAWVFVGALIGCLIGGAKNRAGEGALMGAVLGVIGWLLVAVGPDERPKCPHCRGAVPDGARVCRHCGRALREEAKPSTLVTCHCSACDQKIQFDRAQFDPADPQVIDCPACQARTRLYIPA